MSVYDVFIDPTVISDCIACNFVSSVKKHLIVGKATILEIYEVLKIHRPPPYEGFKFKLKLVDSYKLQGLLASLKPIRTAENPILDYILVLTKSAKVSCVRWDMLKHSIETVSLHFYEHALQNATYEKIEETQLLVGSQARPLFCLRRSNLLVFLPFNVDDDESDFEENSDDGDHNSYHGNNHNGKVRVDGSAKFLYEGSNDFSIRNRSVDSEVHGFAIRGDDIKYGLPSLAHTVELFEPSTIIDVALLDSTIGEIIDLQFLHNYREPTLAVISQVKRTWAGLLPQEKGNAIYTVWSLDVASSTTTTVLKIHNLPFDVHRIMPLKSPLNGSLLVGCNELIHIDSGGIARQVSLNLFVYDSTGSMNDFADNSPKELMLEDCSISMIPNDNKVLMILKTGHMHIVTFDVEGKTIKGLSIDELEPLTHVGIRMENPGSIVALGDNLLFFSGKSSDSELVEISYSESGNGSAEVSKVNAMSEKNASMDIGEDDDDLYDEDDRIEKKVNKSGILRFIKHEIIRSNGPISSFTLGKYASEKFVANLPNPSFNEISIVAASGVGLSSCLNLMTPTVQPIVRSSLRFSQIHRLWIISNSYLITSDDSNQKSEIFDITKSYARIHSRNFINTELTIAMHELDNGRFILQVTPNKVLLLNDKLKRIITLEQELKEFGDAYIINSVFNDEFLMMFFSTGEVVIYSINTYNKSFTKVELPRLLSETIITTGYITDSRLLNIVLKDITVLTNKWPKRKRGVEKKTAPSLNAVDTPKLKTFVLVTGDNRIVVFSRFHNEKCFQLNSVTKFTNRLSLGLFDINGTDPDPSIKQVILNDLGDAVSKDEYMTILTVGGEIYTYKMYFDGENFSFVKEVDLPITGAPQNAYPYGTSLERRMIYFPNVSGLTCLLVTGVVPYFITRSRHSLVKIHKFSKIPIISFVPYSDENIKNGLIYLDTKKNARIVELPNEFNYDSNWPIRRISIGETIKSVAYHESSHTFIVSTFTDVRYQCLDEDGHPVVGTRADKFPALSYKGRVYLISPLSWTPIDSFPLDDNEVGIHVKSLALDIGSGTKRFKRKKEFVLIGTGKYRMEDLAAGGSYRLLEIIDIIPEPGRPETNHKFKIIKQEDTRGAVTALCDVSGRFLIAQGQKVIVRDIKDTTAVSVAFMDLSVYVSEAKSFGNLILFGDTLKSISLAGFDAEPFRMLLLGKDVTGIDVNCADFIYKDDEIFILVADNDKALHLLQYNPEDPTSSNGQRLLRKSFFNTNFYTTCMKTIPKHEQITKRDDRTNSSFQVIASTAEGAMYTVFPIDEFSFRRMFILQQQLMDKEYHHCGLNPRLNRAGTSNVDVDQTSRPILDCEILRRFSKLNHDRIRSIGQKISIKSTANDVWRDLINFQNVLKYL